MNAAGRRLSESRVRENLMHGLRWQAMETETTAPSLDPTQVRYTVIRSIVCLFLNYLSKIHGFFFF